MEQKNELPDDEKKEMAILTPRFAQLEKTFFNILLSMLFAINLAGISVRNMCL